MRAAVSLLFVSACAAPPASAPATGTAPAPSAEPSPSAASAASAASAPESAPPAPTPATGGYVLVGDILAPKHFDPKPTVDALKPQMLDCFNEVRASEPALHGKLKL